MDDNDNGYTEMGANEVVSTNQSTAAALLVKISIKKALSTSSAIKFSK